MGRTGREEGRIVRWTFLETDAGISLDQQSQTPSCKMAHGPIKYTWLGVTTIPVWRRRHVELQMDDGPAETVDLTLLAACTGETFGADTGLPGMAPNHEEAVLVLAPRLSRWRMLNLMGSVKKGKHVGIWGITSHRVRRVNLRPVDARGVASDVPLELPTYIQADGEPILQLPATLAWHPAQIVARGAPTVAGTQNEKSENSSSSAGAGAGSGSGSGSGAALRTARRRRTVGWSAAGSLRWGGALRWGDPLRVGAPPMGVTPLLRRSVLDTGASQGGLAAEDEADEADLVCAAMLEASSVTTTLEPPREERSGFDDAEDPWVDKAASRSKPPMLESSFFFGFFSFFSFFGSGAARAGSGAFRFGALRAVSALAMFLDRARPWLARQRYP